MPQQPFAPIEGVAIKQFLPDQEASSADFEAGDFILTHGKSVFSRLIRFGQAIRFYGHDRKYTWWNHAALIISKEGQLIEALNAGVVLTTITKYNETEYHLVHLEDSLADKHDRDQMTRFARYSLEQEYGWFTIISIAISLLTGGKFTFGFDGQSICSGLVARALERTNAIFNRTPTHIMPADLAKYFKVNPPHPGTSKGKIPGAPYFRKRVRRDHRRNADPA